MLATGVNNDRSSAIEVAPDVRSFNPLIALGVRVKGIQSTVYVSPFRSIEQISLWFQRVLAFDQPHASTVALTLNF